MTRLVYWVLLFAAAIAVVTAPVTTPISGGVLGFLVSPYPVAIVFLAAGALAYSQRPDQPVAHRLLLAGAVFCFFLALLGVRVPPGLALSLYVVQYASLVAFFAMWPAIFAVFPDGRYSRPYERRTVIAVWVAGAALVVIVPLASSPLRQFAAGPAPNPLFVPALASLQSLQSAFALFPLVAFLLLALRYRRAGSEQRRQMLWPLAGGVVAAVSTTASIVLPSSTGEKLIWGLGLCAIPVSVVIGVVQHRLLDIDLIIRRSPIYALLWVLIALVYAALAGVLGITAGQRVSLTGAVALTIVAAMLFDPARRRLETLADRLVFGERRDGYQLLTRLGADLERTLVLDEVGPAVATAVQRGLQAAWVRVFVEEHGLRSEIAVEGLPVGPPLLTEHLTHGGERVGGIECGGKVHGRYDEGDKALLRTIARQAALAVGNVGQARELAASRARILQAQESERRRIERDIHDGVQQEVVALMAKAEIARRLQADAPRSAAALREVSDIAHHMLADLRRLAAGIHPAVLDDQGLVEAIEAQATLLPIGVRLHADAGVRRGRFGPQIEVAAYFVVSEALTNAIKHSGAPVADVTLAADNGMLHVEIRDAGCGFEPGLTAQRGIRGLRDRVEALGGSLTVRSRPGLGTTLEAVLPCA